MAKPNDFDFYCEEAISGKTKIKKVYESNTILAFYHTKPSYNTHIVIVPKKHIHDLRSADDKILTEIQSIAIRIFELMDLDNYGARLVTNLGSFQDTPHLHFHVISDGIFNNLSLEN